MRPIRVLSLFDGMSCGQIALRDMGIPIAAYYASEVDKFAIQQTQLNFPETIQLGDVRQVEVDSICEEGEIDLLIGGSPCQSFSFAGKRAGMKTTENEEIYTLDRYLELKREGFEFEGQSYLFWEYMRILKDLQKRNPKVLFLLENVEMGKKWERVLSEAIGIRGVHINSALVSAQNRRRIYWSNIRVGQEGLFGDAYTDIPQPTDRGILLKHILEDKVDERYFLSEKVAKRIIGRDRFSDDKFKFGADKGSPVLSSGGGNNSDMDLICVAENTYQADNLLYIQEATKKGYTEIHKGEAFDMRQPNSTTRRGRKMDSKCNCLTTQSGDSYFIFEGVENEHLQKNLTDVEGKANSFLATSGKGALANGMTLIRKPIQLNDSIESGGREPYQQNRVYDVNGIAPACMANLSCGSYAVYHNYRIRRITPTECARLQTIPEWYRWECSETQQYRMLGNGWTVEVIKHIFTFMNIK